MQLHHVAVVIFALAQRRFSPLAVGDVKHCHGDAGDVTRFVKGGHIRRQECLLLPRLRDRPRYLHGCD